MWILKILYIDAFIGFGSVGRIVQELYDKASSEGNQCCIAYGRGNAPKGYNVYRIGSSIDVLEAGFESRIFDNHGFASRKATRKLIKFIKEYQPDVINLHSIHGYYLNIKMLFEYLKKAQCKIVWTLHDCWPLSSHSGFINLDENGRIPTFESKYDSTQYPKNLWWHKNSKNYFKKKNIFTQLDTKRLTIVTPSVWLKDLVKISYLAKYNCQVINNGIDLSVFYQKKNTGFRSKYGIDDSTKVLLFIANYWEDRKGLQFVKELAYDLNQEYKIVVIGNLMKQKLPSNILHIDQTQNREELVDIYSSSDYFINPTLADNFPTVNIEAQACGLPVLTFDTGGSAEMISSDTGIKITEKNTDGILEALKIANQNFFSATNCIENAKHFEKNKQYDKYIDLYNS